MGSKYVDTEIASKRLVCHLPLDEIFPELDGEEVMVRHRDKAFIAIEDFPQEAGMFFEPPDDRIKRLYTEEVQA